LDLEKLVHAHWSFTIQEAARFACLQDGVLQEIKKKLNGNKLTNSKHNHYANQNNKTQLITSKIAQHYHKNKLVLKIQNLPL